MDVRWAGTKDVHSLRSFGRGTKKDYGASRRSQAAEHGIRSCKMEDGRWKKKKGKRKREAEKSRNGFSQRAQRPLRENEEMYFSQWIQRDRESVEIACMRFLHSQESHARKKSI